MICFFFIKLFKYDNCFVKYRGRFRLNVRYRLVIHLFHKRCSICSNAQSLAISAVTCSKMLKWSTQTWASYQMCFWMAVKSQQFLKTFPTKQPRSSTALEKWSFLEESTLMHTCRCPLWDHFPMTTSMVDPKPLSLEEPPASSTSPSPKKDKLSCRPTISGEDGPIIR